MKSLRYMSANVVAKQMNQKQHTLNEQEKDIVLSLILETNQLGDEEYMDYSNVQFNFDADVPMGPIKVTKKTRKVEHGFERVGEQIRNKTIRLNK